MLSISELSWADVEATLSEVTVADLSGGLWRICLWPDLSHSSTDGKGSNFENSGPEITIHIRLCRCFWVRRVLRGLLTRFIWEKSLSQAAVEGEIVSKSCSKALMCLTESSFLCSIDIYTARGWYVLCMETWTFRVCHSLGMELTSSSVKRSLQCSHNCLISLQPYVLRSASVWGQFLKSKILYRLKGGQSRSLNLSSTYWLIFFKQRVNVIIIFKLTQRSCQLKFTIKQTSFRIIQAVELGQVFTWFIGHYMQIHI